MDQPEQFGKYLLLEKLAMGGMAEIFLAKAPGASGITKFLAMKRILPQYSANEEFIKMFTEEAKISVNLSHSNIVPIYEFGTEQGQFFIVMEFIEGKNLRQILSRLKKEGRNGFTIDQAIYIVKEVAAGLDHAHRCLDDANGKPLNIIHRDMSPQNIMMSFEGEVKVVDFGIAKAESQEESTKAGTLKGKFSYMSPEQASGEKIDLRTDVFSLGIVLWEVLANERLFTASSELHTLSKIKEGKIPPISKINPKVPEELEKIVNIALAKDAENRYQTCAEFYKDLNRFLNRAYPDFSSHDFSVFIKSLYAEEILANRKKFMEFSRLAVGAPTSSDYEDKTVVSEVNTAAELFSDSGSGADSSLDFKGLRVKKTQTDYAARPNTTSGKSRIKKYQGNKSILSTPNLIVFAMIAIGLGLIVSQLMITDPVDLPITEIEKNGKDFSSTSTEKFDNHNIYITSTPPGASIYIDGKDTGASTPGRVRVPSNTDFQLTLKKRNYIEYSTRAQSRGNGTKQSYTLQEIKTGFLNISAVPRDSEIIINGRKMKERLPIKGYQVPSAVTLKIKAINKRTRTYDQKIISVDEGETREIILRPRRPASR